MMSEDRCRIGEPVFGKSDFAAGRHVHRRYWYGLIRNLVEKFWPYIRDWTNSPKA